MDEDNNNVESEDDRMEEEVPKILNPELRDVFPIFASMLDLESFVNLAKTCKGMYKRCTEDKAIKIEVEEDHLEIYNVNDAPVYSLHPLNVRESHADSYLSALRKLPCRVTFRTVSFFDDGKGNFSIIDDAVRYLKEIGVHTIDDLIFEGKFSEYDGIIPFLKNFEIWSLNLEVPAPPAIVRELLQLNLETLSFKHDNVDESVLVDLLLESSSKIPDISFTAIQSIPKDKFMELLSKIQAGSLQDVTLHLDAVNWNDYDKLPYDHDGPLPEGRPLLFARTEGSSIDEYWFLHWHGNVTKCVVAYEPYTMKIYKCEPWEYPWILRKEEDVLSDLAKQRPEVLCTADHWETFTSCLRMLPSSHEGPLPKERPLYCSVVDVDCFWLLNENDFLVKYEWEDDCATWKPFLATGNDNPIDHPALAKFMFWKLVEGEIDRELEICCDGLDEFDSWFEDCEKLDFDYLGPLPSTRPVVFERTSAEDKNLRIVLFEDGAVQCVFDRDVVTIDSCSQWNLPAILVTADVIKKILQDSLMRYEDEEIPEEANILVDYDKFCDAFEKFKTSRYDPDDSEKRPLVFEKKTINSDGETIDERWFSSDRVIRKATWKDGRFLLSLGDFREFPVTFMKQLFKLFAEAKHLIDPVLLDQEQYLSCLKQFKTVPFDYSGPLESDSPLAFVKKELRHTCRQGATRRPRCKCNDFYVRVWFLWNGLRTTYGSWEEEEKGSEKVKFGSPFILHEMPPALRTKELLKSILQVNFDEGLKYEWLGFIDDLRALFEGHRTLPRNYDGPLPDERPLIFEDFLANQKYDCHVLREDGTVIRGMLFGLGKGDVSATFSLPSRRDFLPPALRSLTTIVYSRRNL